MLCSSPCPWRRRHPCQPGSRLFPALSSSIFVLLRSLGSCLLLASQCPSTGPSGGASTHQAASEASVLCGLIPLRPADRRLWSLLPIEEETHPVSWVTVLTPDQPNFVYTATFLCLGNAKFFFFPLKFSFLITWCLLLLLLTAEFDLLEPVVACIFVYYLLIYLYTYTHINIRMLPLVGLLGLTQQRWISLARHSLW